MPGIDDPTIMLKTIPTIMKTSPKNKHFFALLGSSRRKNKYATTPPIIPNDIGNKNHKLLLGFSGNDMRYHVILQLLFFSVTV